MNKEDIKPDVCPVKHEKMIKEWLKKNKPKNVTNPKNLKNWIEYCKPV